MKNKKIIKLISLIILIISVVVIIVLSLGEKSLFEKVKEVREKYSIEEIREKLEERIPIIEEKELELGNEVTIEVLLQELVEEGTFESIDKYENIGNIGEYEVKFCYNEEGKIQIEYINKPTGIRTTYTLDPVGYTNEDKVSILLNITGNVKSITKPEGLIIYPKNETFALDYVVTANGTYNFIIEDEEGNKTEKSVIVDTIDKLAPNDFEITAEDIKIGINVLGDTTDAEPDDTNVKSGTEKYEYFVKGETDTTYKNYTLKQINELEFDEYSVYSLAYDKAGNYKKSNTITLIKEYYGELVWINDTDANRTIDGQTPTYKNPIIPVGFYALNTDDATWNAETGELSDWNNGLVIKNTIDGNEFVWVPVDGTDVPYKRWCTSGISYTDSKDLSSTNGLDVADNVTDYGGFWVARYEAGLPKTIEFGTINATGKPLSKAGANPWVKSDWPKAKTNAESMYSNEYVQSALINGTQWDTIMKWIQNSGKSVTNSRSWGNYRGNSNSFPLRTGKFAYIYNEYEGAWYSATKTSTSGNLIKTGASHSTKAKNIYDLAGNVEEFTDEMYTRYSGWRITRGGEYINYNPASFRGRETLSLGAFGNNLGFRCQLYIK